MHWNAAPRWYLQQEQGCGPADACTLKTDVRRGKEANISAQSGTFAVKRTLHLCKAADEMVNHVTLLFNHRMSRTGKCVYLHSASNPPMSCSFNFLPYMVKDRRCRQKERRREEKKKSISRRFQSRGGGRCGLLLHVRWCSIFLNRFSEACHYTEPALKMN